tara:strand:- start:18927 stop:19526 length:600 start_codon:yes stop_codon:yes gene_type:complete
MKDQLFGLILLIFIVIICAKMFLESDLYNLSCIVSTIDGNKYCVRVRDDLKQQEVVDLLAKTTVKCKKVVEYMKNKHGEKECVKRLYKNFNPKTVKEILPTSEFTAYSENKGEKLAFCTTTRKDGGSLINENTLMFVALHELSHIMTKSIGHTPEFWKNFKFLITGAKEAGVYTPENYKKNNISYCGMKITDNPYFDLK